MLVRIFRGDLWRASGALLFSALLLLCAGCSAQSGGGSTLRDSVLRGLTNGREPSAPPETGNPSPKGGVMPSEAGSADLALSQWAQKIEGLWVEVNGSAGLGDVLLLYFTGDGRVYVGDEAYHIELEYDAAPSDAWTFINDRPQYIDNMSGRAGEIEIDADGALTVEWESGYAWRLNRPETPRATALLMGSDYFYLAKNAKLAYLQLGEELSEDDRYATVWLNDTVWVDYQDEALIAKYGLEEYFADGGEVYFIYSDDSAWRPLFVIPNETLFLIIDYDDNTPRWETADFEAFLAFVEEYSGEDYDDPPLVYYSGEDADGFVYAIRAAYLA